MSVYRNNVEIFVTEILSISRPSINFCSLFLSFHFQTFSNDRITESFLWLDCLRLLEETTKYNLRMKKIFLRFAEDAEKITTALCPFLIQLSEKFYCSTFGSENLRNSWKGKPVNLDILAQNWICSHEHRSDENEFIEISIWIFRAELKMSVHFTVYQFVIKRKDESSIALSLNVSTSNVFWGERKQMWNWIFCWERYQLNTLLTTWR